MAQEDKGLVLRGLLLFTFICLLATIVLGIMFWRTPTTTRPGRETPLEYSIVSVTVPPLGPFPASVSWSAFVQLGDNMPSAPGWEVRYNAATTLARRGSQHVPWPLLGEMLDEK